MKDIAEREGLSVSDAHRLLLKYGFLKMPKGWR